MQSVDGGMGMVRGIQNLDMEFLVLYVIYNYILLTHMLAVFI